MCVSVECWMLDVAVRVPKSLNFFELKIRKIKETDCFPVDACPFKRANFESSCMRFERVGGKMVEWVGLKYKQFGKRKFDRFLSITFDILNVNFSLCSLAPSASHSPSHLVTHFLTYVQRTLLPVWNRPWIWNFLFSFHLPEKLMFAI